MTRLAPLNGVATSNWAEREVVAHLNRDGWGVLKNGWPDFLVADAEGNVRFIEVKANCTNGLSLRQEKVAEIFAALGMVVELYAARCLCGGHSGSAFRVGAYPVLPQRRVRRASRRSWVHEGQHRDCIVCAPLAVSDSGHPQVLDEHGGER